MTQRRIVLSGCSGGGKSSLLSELARRGHATVEEPGRRIVDEELRGDGHALPWTNPEAFIRRAIDMAIADMAGATGDPVFFDRSALDALIWFDRTGTGLDPATRDSILSLGYYHRVLMAPPWPEIYETDGARRHGLSEALAEFEALCDRLPAYGFETVLVPKLPVAERADWVEDWLAQQTGAA